MPLVLDSGALTRVAGLRRRTGSFVQSAAGRALWPPVIPTVVLVESLHGHAARDANVNRLLKSCIVVPEVPVALARRAAELRHRARRGSAVHALIVAFAEPDGVVFTGDLVDLEALAAHARGVTVRRI